MKQAGFDFMLSSLLASMALGNLFNLSGPQFPYED